MTVPMVVTAKDRAERILQHVAMPKEAYATMSIMIEQEIRDAELVALNGTLEVVARVLEKSSDSLEKDLPEMAPCMPAIKSFARSMAKTFREQTKDRHLFRGDKNKR